MTVRIQTGMRDLEGREIHIGDRLMFIDYDSARWEATTEYRDGGLYIDTDTVVCHANPRGWNLPHPYTRSNGFNIRVSQPVVTLCWALKDDVSSQLQRERGHGHYIPARITIAAGSDGSQWYRMDELIGIDDACPTNFFSDEQLGEWAEKNGWIKEDDAAVYCADNLGVAEVFADDALDIWAGDAGYRKD